MRARRFRILGAFLILVVLIGLAIACESSRRKIAYCRERASHSARQAESLRRAIASYGEPAAGGEADAKNLARARAKAEYQAMLRWYERAEKAFEFAAAHPWVSTPHDPDVYQRGLPDSTYP